MTTEHSVTLLLSVQVRPGVRLHQAVAMETLVTLQLVLVVLATVDIPRAAVGSPLRAGLAVSLGHLVAVSATSCGMNPARLFGPAVVPLDFNNHWVFWVGPALGACLAALLNNLLLRPCWRHSGNWWAELKQLYVLTDKQQQGVLSDIHT
ncbi:aquaporin-1 [Dicentrarchus labrax]|uniref:aquaporin-1 n=1 Tax=Dicentrarchus labrax TaxID=13489 RepID=UPI0021F51CCB|nr:aquaporin-1 [Dicentrarchus labrax]